MKLASGAYIKKNRYDLCERWRSTESNGKSNVLYTVNRLVMVLYDNQNTLGSESSYLLYLVVLSTMNYLVLHNCDVDEKISATLLHLDDCRLL